MICGNVISNSLPSEAVEGCLLKIEGRGAISVSPLHLFSFGTIPLAAHAASRSYGGVVRQVRGPN